MNEAFIGNFLRTILTMSICGSVIALILFALRPVIKDKASKSAQYYLWLIVIAQLIIPFSASLPVNRTLTAPSEASAESSYEVMYPQYNRPIYSLRDALDRYAFSTEEETTRVADIANSVGVGAPIVGEPQNQLPITVHRTNNVIDILMVVWPVGAALFLSITMASYFTFVRNLKRGLITTDIPAENKSKRVSVYKSPAVKTPMLIGVFKVRVVLPDKDYGQTQLDSILQHEMTHLKRRDLLIKWLTIFANAIHWFNPLVYLVRKEMNRACELSCDEAVIKQLNLDERQHYGDTLISVVADSRYPVGVVSTTMCEDKKKLKERLKSIMNYRQSTKLAACLTVVLALTLTVSAIAMSASTADSTERGTIKLDSTKLSDMPVEAIIKGIMDITGAKSEDIILAMDGTYDFRISPDYQWDELANIMRILVSMNETGGEPYMGYQLQFDSYETDIDVFRMGESPAPEYSFKLRPLLDALKYIPVNALNAAFDSPPDMIMIHGSRHEKTESGRPMIYYDASGVKSESGWLQHLAITPMYGDENGGTHGVSSDVVHLFYSEPDAQKSPDEVQSALHVVPDDSTMSQSWQEAYAAFFKDSDAYSGLLDTWYQLPSSDCDGFYLHDFDNNGIPELIISFNDGCGIYVFTYLDTIMQLYKRDSLVAQLYLPSNPSLTGLFCVSRLSDSYLQYENGLMTVTTVSEYPDTGGERVFTILDQRLYDELDKAEPLVLQEINESDFVGIQANVPSDDIQNERST